MRAWTQLGEGGGVTARLHGSVGWLGGGAAARLYRFSGIPASSKEQFFALDVSALNQTCGTFL